MTSSHDRPKRVLGRTARAGEILDLVRSGEAGTVTQLAKSLGVARSTINERIDLLQRIGLLSTAGEATFGRGGPPTYSRSTRKPV